MNRSDWEGKGGLRILLLETEWGRAVKSKEGGKLRWGKELLKRHRPQIPARKERCGRRRGRQLEGDDSFQKTRTAGAKGDSYLSEPGQQPNTNQTPPKQKNTKAGVRDKTRRGRTRGIAGSTWGTVRALTTLFEPKSGETASATWGKQEESSGEKLADADGEGVKGKIHPATRKDVKHLRTKKRGGGTASLH